MRNRTNSSETPFKRFQIRWNEAFGLKEHPYLYRWTFIFFGYSIRIHHWLKSDDDRHFHDHSCDLISIIIRGYYYNVVPIDPDNPDINNALYIEAKSWHPWRAKATDKHWLQIPKEGAWTILLQGQPYHKWGFYVKNKRTKKFVKWRPKRYFSKFGIQQTKDYQ